MSNRKPSHEGVSGEPQKGDGFVKLDTAKYMSPEALHVAQHGPAGAITKHVRDSIQNTGALSGQDTAPNNAPEISDATVNKLATLGTSRIKLGTKFTLRFDTEGFINYLEEGNTEANALRLCRIDLYIEGDGRTGHTSLPLDQAMVWQQLVSKSSSRFSAAAIDARLARALDEATGEQRGIVHPDINRNLPSPTEKPFVEIKRLLPELPLTA